MSVNAVRLFASLMLVVSSITEVKSNSKRSEVNMNLRFFNACLSAVEVLVLLLILSSGEKGWFGSEIAYIETHNEVQMTDISNSQRSVPDSSFAIDDN